MDGVTWHPRLHVEAWQSTTATEFFSKLINRRTRFGFKARRHSVAADTLERIAYEYTTAAMRIAVLYSIIFYTGIYFSSARDVLVLDLPDGTWLSWRNCRRVFKLLILQRRDRYCTCAPSRLAIRCMRIVLDMLCWAPLFRWKPSHLFNCACRCCWSVLLHVA